MTDISLAINRNYTGDDGQRHEETTFVDITFWGRQAEVIGEYMKKGRPSTSRAGSSSTRGRTRRPDSNARA